MAVSVLLSSSRVFAPAEIVACGAAIIVVYLAACLLVQKCGRGMVWWCLPISLLLAGSYALNLHDLGTLYAGITSDQSTNLGYTQNIIHGNYLGDLYEKRVPAQYPPLYFWVLGIAARACGWTALEAWRYSPIFLFLVLPFLTYAVGVQVGGNKRCGFYACFALLALGASQSAQAFGFYATTVDPFALLGYVLAKPYQILGGLLLVSWLVSFGRGPPLGRVGIGWLIAHAVLGACIFLLYSPWFGVGAVALALHGVVGAVWTTRLKYLGWLAVVGATTAVLTAVHWFPYLRMSVLQGQGNSAGTSHFLPGHMDPTWVTTGMGFFGLLFFLALLGMGRARREPGVVALTLGIGVTYTWYFSTYVTYPLFGAAFLPHRVHALLCVLLAAAAAVGIDGVREALAKLGRERWTSPLALSLIGALLLPSFGRWNTRTDYVLARGVTTLSPNQREIVQALDGPTQRTLASCLGPESFFAVSLTRTRLYLSPALAQSNPLTRYYDRVAALRTVAESATNDAELAAGLRDLGIDALLVKKVKGGDFRIDVLNRPFLQPEDDLLSSLLFAPPETDEERLGEITFRRGLFEESFYRIFRGPKKVLFLLR